MFLWAFSLSASLWGAWYALRRFRRIAPIVPESALPPVSILKPLKGCDRGLEANLRSFFELDYPQFELLFSVAERRDAAVPVVERLLKEFPGISARLIVGDVDRTPNPKVNNMMVSYEQAEHDCLLISDSNMRVTPSYLRRMVGQLTGDVGVVTGAVAGRWADNLGGRLEACYLNTFYARWMHIADAFNMAYVLGKSMLFRRSVADRFGGLRHLGQYIAEDYMMGQAMRHLGLRVAVMVDPVAQYIGRYSLKTFWQRHIRWGRIRRSQVPWLFVLEPFQALLLSGACGAYALHACFGVPWAVSLTVHTILWASADLLLIRLLEGNITAKTLFAYAVREVLSLPLWTHAALGNTIQWRGSRLRIFYGGLLEPHSRSTYYQPRSSPWVPPADSAVESSRWEYAGEDNHVYVESGLASE
jgi:ceramide glucosyltransferase